MAVYWKIADQSVHDMFSSNNYLIVNLVFPFFSKIFFLNAPFSDHCYLRVRLGTCKTGLSPPVTLCY